MRSQDPILIIAEAGVNHNGSLDTALRLVDAAADAGADVVKFQTFRASDLAAASARKATYQSHNAPSADDSQLAMLRKLELDEAAHSVLIERCRERGIRFLSTPFDFGSIELLHRLGQTLWKIPSGEITNLPYLRRIGAFGAEVILSTGMSTMDEVLAAVEALVAAGTPRRQITLLHCTTQYPAPLDSVNLLAMNELATLGCRGVGYSDHTRGITVPVAAAALGATVIEKHFTLSRDMEGPDHKASLEPDELRTMVTAIRDVETALGDGHKCVTDAERPNIAVARKSIVAARHIDAGETFTEENLTVKRPGTGMSPMLWDKVIGRQSPRAYEPDECICI
ncbi:MAG: N-acetylneuraminate synthase [Candidatus Amulumruptor caecigallinarius]|nr:N-acetylneuraminate synthase [Candidatus Amulumruptor caecigallinarius]MCM1397735.1 N-acetylneuraminate synthase [Candidatus Amulumruptor caecigallinarius]MCM1454615.1 N-acetylneuraminate synthase [bacterium]